MELWSSTSNRCFLFVVAVISLPTALSTELQGVHVSFFNWAYSSDYPEAASLSCFRTNGAFICRGSWSADAINLVSSDILFPENAVTNHAATITSSSQKPLGVVHYRFRGNSTKEVGVVLFVTSMTSSLGESFVVLTAAMKMRVDASSSSDSDAPQQQAAAANITVRVPDSEQFLENSKSTCVLKTGHICGLDSDGNVRCAVLRTTPSGTDEVTSSSWPTGMDSCAKGITEMSSFCSNSTAHVDNLEEVTDFVSDVLKSFRLDPVIVPEGYESGILKLTCRNFKLCAVNEEGTVGCWGYGEGGQVSTANATVLALPDSVTNVSRLAIIAPDLEQADLESIDDGSAYNLAMSSANYTLCVLDQASYLQCYNTTSQGEVWSRLEFANYGDAKFRSIAIGLGSVCAVTPAGELFCWDYDGKYLPVKQTGVKLVVKTHDFSAINTVHPVTCIAATQTDQSGQSDKSDKSSYTYQCFSVDDLIALAAGLPSTKVESASIGPESVCVQSAEHGIQCSGLGGQAMDIPPWLANNTFAIQPELEDSVCVLTNDGSMHILQDGMYKQLMVGTAVRQMTCTPSIDCVVTTAGQTACWNATYVDINSSSDDSIGADDNRTTLGVQPEELDLGRLQAATVTSLSVCGVAVFGQNRGVCGVTTDKQLLCTDVGDASMYELQGMPEDVQRDVHLVSCSMTRLCVVLSNSSLYCYLFDDGRRSLVGEEVHYALQNGGVISVVAGYAAVCAISDTKSLYCWDQQIRQQVPDDYKWKSKDVSMVTTALNGTVVCVVTINNELGCFGFGYGSRIASAYYQLEEAGLLAAPETTGNDPLAPDAPENSSNGSSAALMISVVVGVVVAVAAALLLVLLVWRRRRRNTRSKPPTGPRGKAFDLDNFQRVQYLKASSNTHCKPAAGPPLSSMYAAADPEVRSILSYAPPGSITSLSSDSSLLQDAALASHPQRSVIEEADVLVCTHDDGSKVVLGEGGQGKVYFGELRGQPVALKEVKPMSSVGGINKMLSEIAVMKKCHHDNIVSLLGMALLPDSILLVMEYMGGGDLFHGIHPDEQGDPDEQGEYKWYNKGRDVALQVASGLLYLHQRRIVHCDIKSSNVMLSSTGQAKIGDMGMAKWMATDLVTRHGDMGTWAYAAPELILNSHISEAVDVYSFGVLLWELVTGERPVRGHMRLPSVPEDCPQHVRDLIQACLSASPDDRPSAQQVLDVLMQ